MASLPHPAATPAFALVRLDQPNPKSQRCSHEPPPTPALDPRHRRHRHHSPSRRHLHLRLARRPLQTRQLARRHGAVLRLQLHHCRASRLRPHPHAHHPSPLGRTQQRSARRPLQNKDGRRRDGALAPPRRLHVFRQLFPAQSHARPLVPAPSRNRLRTNAIAHERFRSRLAPASAQSRAPGASRQSPSRQKKSCKTPSNPASMRSGFSTKTATLFAVELSATISPKIALRKSAKASASPASR